MMKIIKEGTNPYIQQGKCKTCQTVVEVDVRSETTKKEIDSQEIYGHTRRTTYANVAKCPVCGCTINIGKTWTEDYRFDWWYD